MGNERECIEKILDKDKNEWIESQTSSHKKPFEFRILDDEIEVRTIKRNEDQPEDRGLPFSYKRRCIADLHEHLKQNQDWHLLGTVDAEKDAIKDSIEEWSRNENNPVGGFYGLHPKYKGRFASYIPSILEYYNLAELGHKQSQNRMKYKDFNAKSQVSFL